MSSPISHVKILEETEVQEALDKVEEEELFLKWYLRRPSDKDEHK